jgi:hypothetical protein
MPVILGGNTGIYLASLTPPAPSLILDTYPNAAVAYSLRQLRTAYTGTAYTGAAIRVRRSSDNAEQDINFVSGDLDTQSLLDFVGYNLWDESENFASARYVKSNLNVTGSPAYLDVEIAPDGTTTGDKIIENTTNNTHLTTRTTTTLINATDYNISVFLKQGERTKVQIQSNISGTSQTCDLDLTNGTTSNNGFSNTPVVTLEANGWYRFSVTITSGTTSSTLPIRVFLTNGTTNSYLGDGTSGAYVWGFQLTQSSSVKPYGKTTTDVARNAFITTWYDQSGNANNATQATAANQAQIVSSGAVITDPNTGKISATWTGDSYILSSNVAVTQNMLVSGVINRTATLTSQWLLGHNATIPRLVGTSNSGDIISQVVTGSVTHGNITTGAFILSGLRDSSNIVKAWTNTTALTTGTSTGVSGNFSRFGFQNTLGSTGRMVEMIYWDNDKESSRADIVTNQNDYWEVY